MATILWDKLEQASGSNRQGMMTITRSAIVEGVSGISDGLGAVSLGDAYGGCVLTDVSVSASLPDSQAVRLLATYTMNNGILQSSGSLKSEQWSYDKNGQVVNIQYTSAGKTDSYTAIFSKQNPTGVYRGSQYETSDALTVADGLLGTVNSGSFMGYDKDLVMLVSCESQQVAPGWFNNSYVFVYDQYGWNARVAYYNRWGKIPKNIASPGVPPQAPGQGNGWTIVDEYKESDFSGTFGWMESLL